MKYVRRRQIADEGLPTNGSIEYSVASPPSDIQINDTMASNLFLPT